MAKPASQVQQGASRTLLVIEAGRSLLALLALVAMTWLAGCATTGTQGGHAASPLGAAPPDCSQGCGGSGFSLEEDPFQRLQEAAGLEEDSRHEAEAELETDDARALWEALARTRTTLRNFGPRRSLAFVLRQVLTRDEDVPYAELLERLRPFRSLAVMRPDGYLVNALTGSPLQRILARLTGQMPEGAHAHHVFPRSLAKRFRSAGINVHDPRFGAWWEKSSHLKNVFDYNKRWLEFWAKNPKPSLEQVLQFGRELAREFGFQVNY